MSRPLKEQTVWALCNQPSVRRGSASINGLLDLTGLSMPNFKLNVL